MNGCGLSQSSRQSTPPTVPSAPVATYGPESVVPFPGSGAPPLRFFLLQFPDASLLTSSPSERLAVPFPQLTSTPPLLAITRMLPFVSTTSNSVHASDAGVTVI